MVGSGNDLGGKTREALRLQQVYCLLVLRDDRRRVLRPPDKMNGLTGPAGQIEAIILATGKVAALEKQTRKEIGPRRGQVPDRIQPPTKNTELRLIKAASLAEANHIAFLHMEWLNHPAKICWR